MADNNPIRGEQQDIRQEQILNFLELYNSGGEPSKLTRLGKNDVPDRIIDALNALPKVNSAPQDLHTRIEKVLQVLLKYTVMDFSEVLEVTEKGDEIDAIAIGLNTMAEELQAARSTERLQLQAISESKEHIEIILNSAPNAVVVINEAGEIIRWNTKAEKIFGWNLEEVLNKPMHKIIMPERYVDAHFKGFNRFLETGTSSIMNTLIEISAVRRNGEEFPIELGISSARANGKYIFIAFIIDISSRKRAEQEIIETNKLLAESNQELEAFTYSVSHDLRAPLRALNGYSQLLLERCGDKVDETERNFVHAIEKNARRMGRLIDDLLALSRFSRAELQLREVDMNRVVSAVIEELGRGTDISKVKFEIHTLPPANADQNLVLQVYSNLIGNAVKYSSQSQQPHVEIGSFEKDNKIVYFVKDNGSGFDMQFYDKLFGVFQRLHDASEFEGTGVGLAIVKRIITKHRGTIWAKAEQGKGATFYFTLN